MMTQAQYRQILVDQYKPNDSAYGHKTNQAITEFFGKMKLSPSKTDPLRLGSRSVFISKLREQLIAIADPFEFEKQPNKREMTPREDIIFHFNGYSLDEQLRFQIKSRRLGTNEWVHKLQIFPSNIADIKMPDTDAAALIKIRKQIDTAKLRAESDEIDVAELMEKLFPSLTDPKAKLNAIVVALLLATGRRTIEILQTAEFYLSDNMTSAGYTAMFRGQAKSSVMGIEDYQIPLLVPFHIVKAAMDRVRKMANTEGLSSVDINETYARGINNCVKRMTKMDINPHSLRSVYALSVYALLPKGKRMSLMGFISSVLGHASVENSAYYQRITVSNVRLWTTDTVEEDEDEEEWNITCVAEAKRLIAVKEMMLHKKPITASSIRTAAGGMVSVSQRFIDNNKERIDAYNATLIN